MRQVIQFSHDYHKLHRLRFTTIRGKSAAAKFKVDQSVEIVICGQYSGAAVIEKVETKRLVDIPLPVLQMDAAFPGLRVNCHADFMGLVNALRRNAGKKDNHPAHLMQSVEEEVTIIHLAWWK